MQGCKLYLVLAVVASGVLNACGGGEGPRVAPSCGEQAEKLRRLLDWWWIEGMRGWRTLQDTTLDPRKGPFTLIISHNNDWGSLPLPANPPSAYRYSVQLGVSCDTFREYSDSLKAWWLGLGHYEGRGAYAWFQAHDSVHNNIPDPPPELQPLSFGPDSELNINQHLMWWHGKGPYQGYGTYNWLWKHNVPKPDPEDDPPPPPDPWE
jgi:hypothetical protein